MRIDDVIALRAHDGARDRRRARRGRASRRARARPRAATTPACGCEDRKIASIGVHVSRGVTTHGFAVNVDNDLDAVRLGRRLRAARRADDLDPRRGRRPTRSTCFRKRMAYAFADGARPPPAAGRAPTPLGVDTLTGVSDDRRSGCHQTRSRVQPGRDGRHEGAGRPTSGPSASRKPPWFKVPPPGGAKYRELTKLIRDENLHTVCQEAACPNVGECWERGTATFMILGDTCTRRCGFCNVKTGKPTWNDPLEPLRVARSVARMGLRHAVITSRRPRRPARLRRARSGAA